MNGMNGYSHHPSHSRSPSPSLDPFGPASSSLRTAVRTFDAFPKVKRSYTEAHTHGPTFTVFLILLSAILTLVELSAYWRPHESHLFSVEKGVGHEMEFNLDVVVLMQCEDLRVHVQDASGDRIFAMETLALEGTDWTHYASRKNLQRYDDTNASRRRDQHRKNKDPEDSMHVREVVDARGRWFKRSFPKTASPPHGHFPDACRIFGTLSVNKVAANAHITARGHMYAEWPPIHAHLGHDKFNFTHIMNELSFGPYYPSLENPLDNTLSLTPAHFFKYQYYMSIVPTLIVTSSGEEIRTNQYAVTSQNHLVGEQMAPGIFFKYDIEPIQLIIKAETHSFVRLIMRIVNVLSGVLVAGQWMLSFADVVDEVWGERLRKVLGRRKKEGGMLLGSERRSM